MSRGGASTQSTTVHSAGRTRCLAAVVGIVVGLAALLALPGALPRAGAGEPGTAPFVQVRIDKVTPTVVTTTSEPVVTVIGTVANVGDRPVRDVMVRLEHAAAVASSAGLRTNLDGANDQFRPVDTFVTISEELQRGQEIGFTLSAPVRAVDQPSLEIDRPGVYPVLVNVNGTPDYGEPARLDDARFLLPVLGVPANPDEPAADPLTGVVAPDTSKPLQLTMLWPLADRPRLAPGAPGGSRPVRLSDDELAKSLAAGGRLDTLLSAPEFATSPAVDPDGAVGRSLCLAVDPDLLVTVNAMTSGYVVADSSDGATRPGAGQAAAGAWLDRLRSLAHRMCVAASPYAQADLGALQRVGDPGLNAIAVTSPADVVDQILGVTSTRGVTLLGDGPLTGGVVDLLSGQGNTVAVTAGDCAAQDTATGALTTTDVKPRRMSPQVIAAPFDPAVGAALAAAGAEPVAPTYLDASLNVRLRHASAVARRQDALGSMLWRALEPGAGPRVEVLMPPTSWAPQPDDAQAILTTLATTIRAGLAVPRPLTVTITDAQTAVGAPQPRSTDGVVARGDFDDSVVAEINTQVTRLWGLTSALTTDVRTGLSGVAYTAPLREDMLRALSQAEPPDSRNGLAHHRLGTVGAAIDDLFAGVTIVNPGGSYTLATEHSPLPLALRNDLAVPVRVRLQVDAPPGMTVSDVGEIELPPGYLPLRVPIEVRFNQRVAVDVALRTPDGLPLGEPARLSVHANAYGKVLFALTLTAAAVLVTLAGRRLWHRFRGQPDPADLDRPDPEQAVHPGRHRATDEEPPA
ncbi:hypothetical protein ACAG26_14615 [Mycobacterium sp. pUA109]|uniref:hypothetical protein n=1 Tax=Mycobacterium sp. pUA109 TaxID=3238982 RepID=UPI00351ABFE7